MPEENASRPSTFHPRDHVVIVVALGLGEEGEAGGGELVAHLGERRIVVIAALVRPLALHHRQAQRAAYEAGRADTLRGRQLDGEVAVPARDERAGEVGEHQRPILRRDIFHRVHTDEAGVTTPHG